MLEPVDCHIINDRATPITVRIAVIVAPQIKFIMIIASAKLIIQKELNPEIIAI